ncbi:hypothetical protein NQ315_013249 [Exocentrus adspersus]|uniref:DDE-1 domain-containing protein n=1 Tax=Exocentrus adspersus TaxID=1586481 RepID=A0AAV8V7E9_9CUCU|nr:hypothetical protein NQ315_013249 [Exocentrus adspersus]
MPTNWLDHESAGKDWFTGFINRNKDLALRKPEATSLSRAMGFNKPVINLFFENLDKVYSTYKFQPHQIYNVDESGLTTVQSTTKVIAPKGAKQIGQITSAERGDLVTACCAINAIGNDVPPLLIFPRVNFKNHMLFGCPPGSVGEASPSGWMTHNIFVTWLQHFISHTKPTPKSPVLLLMDNLEAHVSYDSVTTAKKNNVILLTLPPHTSHRLQPLDRCVYGPLKKYYNDECRSWLLTNPGKRISIYEVSQIFGRAYPQAFSKKNIISGFRCTGIYPFDKNIFPDSHFIAAEVTDMPYELATGSNTASTETQSVCIATCLPQPSTSNTLVRPQTPTNSNDSGIIEIPNQTTPEKQTISPFVIQPLPKVSNTAATGCKRRKKLSKILTETPNIDEMKENLANKSKPKKKAVEKIKCKIVKPNEPEMTDSESDIDMKLMDDDDDEDWFEETEKDLNIDVSGIKKGSFVLVKYI